MDKLGDFSELNKLAKDKLGVDVTNTSNIGESLKEGYNKYSSMSSDDKSKFNNDVMKEINDIRGVKSDNKN